MKARLIKRALTSFTAAAVLGASVAWGTLAYDADEAVNTFTFTDDGVSASTAEGGYKISGTDLTINAAGTYVITGECVEGTVTVKKGTEGVVLILDSLTLTSSTSAPISINKGASATIVLQGESSLTDAEDPANETSTDETVADAFEGAAIKVKSGASLTILGDGTLDVDSSACKNGIKGGAASTITIGSESDSPKINVTAANTGIAADGVLNIVNGNITVTADNDGIKSAPDEDDTESAGILNISGGVINVTSGDDGIKGQNEANITGGTITVSADDDGIKSDYTLNIGTKDSETGPDITIVTSYEGLEGATVNLYSGSGTINASDDGVNAANSDLDNTGYDFAINIFGGEWVVNADGDGLDSNGNINIYGGTTEVFGSTQNDNAALDYGDNGNGLYLYGGTVVGIGSSGMATVPTEGTYLVYGSSGMGQGGWGGSGQQGGGFPGQQGQQGQSQTSSGVSVSAGDTVVIKNSAGETVYSTTAKKSADNIVYASDTLDESESYTLYVNGTSVSTVSVSTGDGTTSTQPGQGGQGGPGQQGGDPFSRVPGDADGDGEVTISDLAAIQKYLAGWSVTINEMNADVTGDRQVTIDDLTTLQKYLAGWSVTLK